MTNIFLITGVSIDEAIPGLYDNILSPKNKTITVNLIIRNISIRRKWLKFVEAMEI